MKQGRKHEHPRDYQAALVSILSQGHYLRTACIAAGISKSTVYSWLKLGRKQDSGEFHEFAQAVDKAQANFEMEQVANVREAAKTDWKAGTWLLERKFPGRWGLQIRITVEAELNAALDKLERALSPEIYEQVLAVLADEGYFQPSAFDASEGKASKSPSPPRLDS